jgi:hypothetical protein
MTKQTFTTGQVLTAAQMTSLQQTAMGGGSTTAKTASYTLVAADAGTVVQMNSASATTITVNTALFAAGDTVQIQNIGAGVCTVTAGTATVSTAASLALSQYEGGQLYFNTTSAALFFDFVQAASASGLTFVTGTTFSAVTSVSLPTSTFTSTYNNYQVVFIVSTSSGSPAMTGRYRASGSDNTTSNYYNAVSIARVDGSSATQGNSSAGSSYNLGYMSSGTPGTYGITLDFLSPQATAKKQIAGGGFGYNSGQDAFAAYSIGGWFNATTAFDAFSLIASTGTITGSYYVYGYAKS